MKTIITFKPIQELTNSQVIIYNGFINNECIEYFLKEVERLYNKETRDNILKNLKDYNFNFLIYHPLPDIYEDLTLEGLYLLQELSLEY